MLNEKGLLHSEIQCTSEQLRGDVFRTSCIEKQLPEIQVWLQQQPKARAWLNITPRIFSVQLHGKRCQLAQKETLPTLLSQI